MSQLALSFGAPEERLPRRPVWPPMPLRAALTPPPLPAPKRRRPRHVPPVPFHVLYLVGCGRAKQGRRTRARDLYTGNLFRACRRHAEAHGTTWRILSGRYGVLRPETVIEPYDASPPRRQLELLQWATSAATRLTSDPNLAGGFRVVCLAGAAYSGPICAVLVERGIECTEPLAGLGIGRRLRWLEEHT